MTQQFETGCASIDLSGPPWGVTTVVSLWVRRNSNGTFDLFRDADCLSRYNPADLPVWADVRTGLYFYIAASSTPGTTFCDGLNDRPNPVLWPGSATDLPPATVTYGKIQADRKAFSMMDYCQVGDSARHAFDLEIEFENAFYSVLTNLTVESVDPTIVQKGEEPPGGGG